MTIVHFISLTLAVSLLLPANFARAAEPNERQPAKEWNVSAGTGLIFAPAFTGAKNYNLLAVPDLRIAYKELFFANINEGIGYALINQDGWRLGPVLTYTFSRNENDGGSIFRIAGNGKRALQGMGNLDGMVSVGGFVEYSLKPYKVKLHVHKGVTAYEGVTAEGKISYSGVIQHNGPPLIYSFGPHIKYADQHYTSAYWGISPEQSLNSGLEQYHPNGGITAYGVNAFALLSLTGSVSASVFAAFDRLAPVVADSPLVRGRGSANQVLAGLFISYRF